METQTERIVAANCLNACDTPPTAGTFPVGTIFYDPGTPGPYPGTFGLFICI